VTWDLFGSLEWQIKVLRCVIGISVAISSLPLEKSLLKFESAIEIARDGIAGGSYIE
jgi:hypothetical protein